VTERLCWGGRKITGKTGDAGRLIRKKGRFIPSEELWGDGGGETWQIRAILRQWGAPRMFKAASEGTKGEKVIISEEGGGRLQDYSRELSGAYYFRGVLKGDESIEGRGGGEGAAACAKVIAQTSLFILMSGWN